MQDQRIEDDQTTARFSERDNEKAVIELLLDDSLPWTIDEVVREVSSDSLEAIDAIGRLVAAGLLHRHDEFVFPTRTARRADEIGNG
jgi:hypothetical protein